MREQEIQGYGKIKQSRFPVGLFWVYFGTLLLMSGFHQGFVVLVSVRSWPVILEVGFPTAYWALVAAVLTLYTRHQIKKSYEKPMREMADATRRVASGDFTVFVPTIHTQEKYDYLDVMIRDFNKMVEELGSVETLKTDFFPTSLTRLRRRLRLSTAMWNCLKRMKKRKESGRNISKISVGRRCGLPI